MSNLYFWYKSHGICPCCKTEQAMLGNVLCFDCRMETKKLYEWYKSIGICPRCRRNKAKKGNVHCPECLQKHAETMKRRRHGA